MNFKAGLALVQTGAAPLFSKLSTASKTVFRTKKKMASRKSSKNSKNNTIYLIVLLLLLLLAGWLLWKIMSPRPARQTAVPQTAGVSQPVVVSYPTLPAANYAPIPTVSFSMPPAPARQTAAQPQQSTSSPVVRQPAQQTAAHSETASRVSPAPKTAPTTARRAPAGALTKRSASTPAASSTLSAPTRPTRPAAPPADTVSSLSGSPIQGMAIVRNKYYDSSTGRYYLFCASDKTSLIYTYEVDAGTYNEANIGLMYNPAKVASWKFVSSQ